MPRHDQARPGQLISRLIAARRALADPEGSESLARFLHGTPNSHAPHNRILNALLDVSIVGDDSSAPMAQRPHVTSLLADPDPKNMVAALVHVADEVNARTAAIYRILTSAAASDADAATLLDELARQRQQGQANVARALAQRKALRPPLREADAKDLIYTLVSPEIYRLLVLDRGWSPTRYEKWLTDTLADQLLPHQTQA